MYRTISMMSHLRATYILAIAIVVVSVRAVAAEGECPKNEEWGDCGTACPKTCKNYSLQTMCPAVCKSGCFCKSGFVRNDNGKCVRIFECRSSENRCPANEEYQECGTLCPRTCANYGALIKCVAGCKVGCFCKEGFIRNDDGKCVKPEQCVPGGCPRDKVYTTCVNPCNDCYRKGNCDNPGECIRGCDCPPGQYKTGSIGVCVPEEQCPIIQCPENEMYTNCGSACPVTCSSLKQSDFACIQVCREGCFCKDGFVRNDQGRCVRPEQCPGENRCPANEQYQECGTICPRTCANYGALFKCAAICKKGCFCKEGLIRNDDGKCVKPEQCIPGGCPPDKVYTSCVNPCNDCYRKGTCDNRGECVRGCDCPPGQYRTGYSGVCVPEEQCPIYQCPENEMYTNCGSACPVTCSSLKQSDFACTEVCKEGCFCKDGFVRNDQGRCVRPEQCPAENQCPKNEVYMDCGTACPITCKNYGIRINCIALCVPGCFCKEGLVRNDDGKCVEPNQCIPGGCPKNEQYSSCANTCDKCCTKGKCESMSCSKGCECLPGFLRSAQNGLCIPKSQCPEGNCPANEVYSDCVNPCNDCYTKGNCNFLVCNTGCDCRKGYYRDEKTRRCIPEIQCPWTYY